MKKIFLLAAIILSGSLMAQNSGIMTDLAKVKSGMRSMRVSSYDKEGYNVDKLEYIKPGEKVTLCDIKDAGIINHIWFTFAPGPKDICRNDIILRIYWDGNDFPSVESPVGPFFGQGWDEQYIFTSFPLNAGPREGTGLSCYFAMPFGKGARVEIENQTDVTLDNIFFYIDYYKVDKLDKDMGRFHAWYNTELTGVEDEGENANIEGAHNYVFADIKGKGQFVGVNYYVNTPTAAWYGEGDDMWFIDGEKQPSLVGTGTEDFFNTSWCPKEVFMSPFFGAPRVNENASGWHGRTHVYRFFITDPVYFDTSLKATIEHGTSNDMNLELSTVAYWYQSEAMPLPAAPKKEDRVLRETPNFFHMHKWKKYWEKHSGSGTKAWGDEIPIWD